METIIKMNLLNYISKENINSKNTKNYIMKIAELILEGGFKNEAATVNINLIKLEDSSWK